MAPRQCDECNETCVSLGDGHWERVYDAASRRSPTVADECAGCRAFLCGDDTTESPCVLNVCPSCENTLCAECYGDTAPPSPRLAPETPDAAALPERACAGCRRNEAARARRAVV